MKQYGRLKSNMIKWDIDITKLSTCVANLIASELKKKMSGVHCHWSLALGEKASTFMSNDDQSYHRWLWSLWKMVIRLSIAIITALQPHNAISLQNSITALVYSAMSLWLVCHLHKWIQLQIELNTFALKNFYRSKRLSR